MLKQRTTIQSVTSPIRRILLFLMGELLAIPMFAYGAPQALIPGRKQLFLDDAVIQRMSHLTRTMHSPQKRGAVLKPDVPSDGYSIEVRTAPCWIPAEKVYKIIYLAYTDRPGPAMAISRDGLRWEKPALGLYPLGNSKANNRILEDPALSWPLNCLCNFLYDGDETNPARRYKALIGAVDRRPVVSSDAIHWTLLKGPPIASGDESQLMYDRLHRRFLAFVKSFNATGRAVALATSTDFDHWSKPQTVFNTDDEDRRQTRQIIKARVADPGLWPPMYLDPEPPANYVPAPGSLSTWTADVYNMAVFPYEGLYIGLPAVFYRTGLDFRKTNTDGFHHIQLTVSRDLKTWKRLGNRQAFIGPSRIDQGLLGIFDRTQLLPCSLPVERGEELWFYYSGLKWRDCRYQYHKDGTPIKPEELKPTERADLAEGSGAMCLAVLRRDGFISLDAGPTEGTLLTKPLICSGKTLYLNLDTAKGQARVELLDGKGHVLPGFSRNDCLPITGDSVRMLVQWKGKKDLSRLDGKRTEIKVYLMNASLYGLWTMNE